ncbi:tetratricopeptide repeat-containing protein [Prunus dulcis]|uniref:Tetratricopeptide repeat-containing protein n=1 Tax=Prunus dulcis TaxID=3755 RepID=A0A4Y1RP55_PRUDU|nr:tetratricopeptide repeat-containing protein [Prunus dulcis]
MLTYFWNLKALGDGALILTESLFNGTEDLRCELGVAGVLRISFLEELNLADNANLWRYRYPRKLILLNRVQQLGLNLVIVKMMKLELKLLHLVSMTAAGIVFCMVKSKIWFSSETLLQKGLIFLPLLLQYRHPREITNSFAKAAGPVQAIGA